MDVDPHEIVITRSTPAHDTRESFILPAEPPSSYFRSSGFTYPPSFWAQQSGRISRKRDASEMNLPDDDQENKDSLEVMNNKC
eukprot:g971.t1